MIAPPGFTVRPGTLDDAPAAAQLINAFERAYLAEPDTVDSDEVASWWAHVELERDTRFSFDADGRLVGAAALYERRGGELDLDGFVHPEAQGHGLGGAMVAWLEEEAVRRGRTVARTSVITADSAAARLMEARGYACVRHFYRMAIDLDGPPLDPEWPAGFEVSAFRPGDEEVVHAVLEEAFSDHWGQEAHDLEHWRKHTAGAPWWDPSLVYVVREGDEVVAAEVNAIRFGGGWIGTLGVRAPWRGHGLGRALLLTAFAEFHRRGETRVALAVDAGNETGATHLYESVGMWVAWQADVWEKRL